MSLFDVLRYPLSDNPTEQELAALPIELRNDWMMNNGWGFLLDDKKFIDENPNRYMAGYYDRHKSYPGDNVQIHDLRNRIKEYNEPI